MSFEFEAYNLILCIECFKELICGFIGFGLNLTGHDVTCFLHCSRCFSIKFWLLDCEKKTTFHNGCAHPGGMGAGPRVQKQRILIYAYSCADVILTIAKLQYIIASVKEGIVHMQIN